MLEQMQNVVSRVDEGLADLRYESTRKQVIQVKKGKVNSIRNAAAQGGHMRLFLDGGVASFSFSSWDDIDKGFKALPEQARLSGRQRTRKARIQPLPPLRDAVELYAPVHAEDIALQEKIDLLKEYEQYVRDRVDVVMSTVSYNQETAQRYFYSTEDRYISQESLFLSLSLHVFVQSAGDIQSMAISFGGNENFGELANPYERLNAFIEQIKEMKTAKPIPGGNYNVILNPILAGVFIHEAFGHLSEAEHLYYNPQLSEQLALGKQIASPILTVVDDPNIMEDPGYYAYDDEGVRGARTEIIKSGCVNHYLHSRESAAHFNQELTGNTRAGHYRFTPLIRMSNIFIQQGKTPVEDLFASLDDGYYLLNAKGGQTVGNQFTFGAQYGYKVRNGKK